MGPIEPQNGWAASGVNLPFTSISSPNPFTGTQHLRFVHDTTQGLGAQRLVFSPLQPTPPNTSATVYVKVDISNDQGADYDVVGQAPSQGFLSWRVKFSFSDNSGFGPGTIYVLDNPGSGVVFVNTGTLWTPGVYKELRVDLDIPSGSIRYYYGGVLIYTGVVFAGTSIEQMVFLTDNFQLTPAETGDYDALSVQTLGEGAVGVQSATWSQVKALMR